MAAIGQWSDFEPLFQHEPTCAHAHRLTNPPTKNQTLDSLFSEFMLECIVKLLETVSVIIIISGTLFLFEVLGEVPGFDDTDGYLRRDDVDAISFLGMMYFTFITISTVGYGDYSPKTTLARIFIFAAVMGGVTYFSILGSDILALINHLASGKGKYAGPRNGRNHVLLIGGGCEAGNTIQVGSFIQALCAHVDYDSEQQTPEVVILARNHCSDQLAAFIRAENKEGSNIHYFVGSPMSYRDLERVLAAEAKMVFIISNFNAPYQVVHNANL